MKVREEERSVKDDRERWNLSSIERSREIPGIS